MNCAQAERTLSGYLDGAIYSEEHDLLREHLALCGFCRKQLEGYRVLATCLAHVEPAPAPADLALRIRVQASRTSSVWARLSRWGAHGVLSIENILEPLAVPATGGFLTALAVFVLVVQSLLVNVPREGAVPEDPPLNLVQPAKVESLAPFPMPGMVAEGTSDSGGLFLEAILNSHGEVVCYKILSGPHDKTVKRQIDQMLLFSRFRPQLNFGVPTNGGRVFLSFSQVYVRG
jgi:hypothetical protein